MELDWAIKMPRRAGREKRIILFLMDCRSVAFSMQIQGGPARQRGIRCLKKENGSGDLPRCPSRDE